MTPLLRPLTACLALAVAAVGHQATAQGPATRQGLRDLELVRQRPMPFESMLKIRAAASYVSPADEDVAAGREEDFSALGFVHYRDESFADRDARFDLYAGTDGAFLASRERIQPGQTATLELAARYFPWYREGFYNGDDFIPTGRYEGTDWSAYLGLGSEISEGYTLELGPFYRSYSFDRNDTTDQGYTIPDDFNAFGGRLHFEQSALQLDRRTGRPIGGFLVSLRGEYERNDSDKTFGTGLWSSKLPTAFWRGWGHLEWYFPTTFGTWELMIDGGVSADSDRIYNHNSERPVGFYWGDATLGPEIDWGGGFYTTPYAQLQYTRTNDEFGLSSDDNFWFGAGAKIELEFSPQFKIWAEYSYLNNPSRPSISFENDVYGEHQAFAGIELTFGG